MLRADGNVLLAEPSSHHVLRSSHCKRMAHLLLLDIERIIVISQNPLWASSEDHEAITIKYACLRLPVNRYSKKIVTGLCE